jgi:DNA polymerase type B, organellar and viral
MRTAAQQAAYRARKREAGLPVEDKVTARARKARWRHMVACREAERQGQPYPAPPVPRPPARIKPTLKPFLGIDGEGCGQDRKGRQHYMLLCAGNAAGSWELYTGKPLSTEQCLDWICSLPGTDDAILSGFSFGYDVTMILRDLPTAKRTDLLADKHAWNPNDRFHKPLARYTHWRNFGIEYLPNNYFRVCRLETVEHKSPDGKIVWLRSHPIKGSARTIYEGFGFFQRKFARALQDFNIGTAAERRMIAANKAERNRFTRMTRTVRDYCALECELHAEMMEGLRANCLASNIKPRTWNGPGKLATVLHHDHDTITVDMLAPPLVPDGLLQMADAAYYGGRFELRRIGRLSGRVWEYDLNSAYPAAMQALPCLLHGTWRYEDPDGIRQAHAAGALYVATVAYQHSTAAGCRGMCGLPHRQSASANVSRNQYAGVLAWPLQGQGTYWSVEIHSAELLGAKLRFGSGWVYSRQCDCKPFDWIAPLYAERKRLGSGTQGYPLKLAINSLYGKLAQRVGNPRYANPLWAGLITAMTRARLNEAIALNPDAIAMIATDGIYSTKPLALPISDLLGAWSVKRHDAGLFIVQPGLYWPMERGAKPKTRGVSAGWFNRRRRLVFERAWDAYASLVKSGGTQGPPTVQLPIRLFIGLRLAEARGNSDLAGRWEDTHKAISFDWHGKRGLADWRKGPHVATLPLPGGLDWVSASYDADPIVTALADTVGEEFEDQPDYLQMLDSDVD